MPRLLKASVVILMGLFFSGCGLVLDQWKEIPPDRELEEVFRSNRAVFEELVRMSDEDRRVVRIANDFTWVSGIGLSNDSGELGFSKERWEEYKIRFRKLNLENGITRGEDGSVWFSAFGRGLSVSGISKEYVFSKATNDCRYDSLDIPEPFKDWPRICKRLDENWYLYLIS